MLTHYMFTCPARRAAKLLSHWQHNAIDRPPAAKRAEAEALAAARIQIRASVARARARTQRGRTIEEINDDAGQSSPLAAVDPKTYLYFFAHQPVDAYIGKGNPVAGTPRNPFGMLALS